MSTPKTFEQAEEALAKALPGYESRQEQQRLAKFIEDAIDHGYLALAEAGTGTGKSMAALIPAILSGKRTVVSTSTIALQNQYATKDLPFLQQNLGVPFTWTLLKGRGNYACVAKLNKAPDGADSGVRAAILKAIDNQPELDGDLDSINTAAGVQLPEGEFRKFTTSGTECPGASQCPFGSQCLAQRKRERASKSDVVVVNSALLMTDVKVKISSGGAASMLGGWDTLIVDEAHELEDIATSQLEQKIKQHTFEVLVRDAISFATTHDSEIEPKVLASLQINVDAVWEALPSIKKGDRQRLTLGYFEKNLDPYVGLVEGLRKVATAINKIQIANDDKRAQFAKQRLLRRMLNLVNTLQDLVLMGSDSLVRWIEQEEPINRRMKAEVVIHTAPIKIGDVLRTHLWSQGGTVLMSATMSSGGDFSYLKNSLGAQEAVSMTAGSPFDYPNQSMLYVPRHGAPHPTKEANAFSSYSVMTMKELISASGGGALLLFTSRTAMRDAHTNLADMLEDAGLTVLMQGQQPNGQLARTFKEDTHSVLFALKSFFTGIDIPGDALRLVIINKLPFAVPTDPIIAARTEVFEKSGRSAFSGLTIPSMTLTLEQAFGRAIRTRSDRAVIAILDSRLTSTGWGRKIVSSLPDARQTSELRDVKEFFA